MQNSVTALKIPCVPPIHPPLLFPLKSASHSNWLLFFTQHYEENEESNEYKHDLHQFKLSLHLISVDKFRFFFIAIITVCTILNSTCFQSTLFHSYFHVQVESTDFSSLILPQFLRLNYLLMVTILFQDELPLFELFTHSSSSTQIIAIELQFGYCKVNGVQLSSTPLHRGLYFT